MKKWPLISLLVLLANCGDKNAQPLKVHDQEAQLEKERVEKIKRNTEKFNDSLEERKIEILSKLKEKVKQKREKNLKKILFLKEIREAHIKFKLEKEKSEKIKKNLDHLNFLKEIETLYKEKKELKVKRIREAFLKDIEKRRKNKNEKDNKDSKWPELEDDNLFDDLFAPDEFEDLEFLCKDKNDPYYLESLCKYNNYRKPIDFEPIEIDPIGPYFIDEGPIY